MNPIVLVYWNDAWANSSSFYDPDFEYKPIPQIDTGYLVLENEHGILTARTYDAPSDRYRGESFVPWEMVEKVEILEIM